MPTATTSAPVHATSFQPYLTVHDAVAAIAWYGDVLGAVESGNRYVDEHGHVGHAEITIGEVVVFLSDESPDYHALTPQTLGGTTVGLHLYVDDVDAVFARAERAGARIFRPPNDEPYGDRSGTFFDPYGHKWMVATRLDEPSLSDIRERTAPGGFTVEAPPPAKTIWPSMNYADAPAAIRFLVDVVGFEERMVVPGEEEGVVAHSELVWPEGGGVMVGSAHRGEDWWAERPTGQAALYVVTDDPDAVYERVRHVEGVEIIREPNNPDYDPSARGFDFRDPEGNLWSFGTYRGTP